MFLMKKFIHSGNLAIRSGALSLFLLVFAMLSVISTAKAQCSLNADDVVAISLSDDDCETTLTQEMFLSDDGLACSIADHYEFEVRSAAGVVLIPRTATAVIDHTFLLKGPYQVKIWAVNALGTTLNTANSIFTVLDNMAPVFMCPTDTVEIYCWQQDTYKPTATDNCTYLPVITKTSETIKDNNCEDNWPANVFRYIDREYVATDTAGNNSAVCKVTIQVNRLSTVQFVNWIKFPKDFIKANGSAISCIDAPAMKDADGNFIPAKSGWPYLVYPDNNPSPYEIAHEPLVTFTGITARWDTTLLKNDCVLACNIASTYNDVSINSCPDCVEKVVRFWTVVETSCQYPERVRTNIQTLEVVDTIDPVIVCPVNKTITTNTIGNFGPTSFGDLDCGARYTFPVPQITDQCCNQLTWTISVTNDLGMPIMFADTNATKTAVKRDLPLGVNTVTYTAYDKAGNSSACTWTVTVIDDTEPVAICQQFTVVSLTYDGEAEAAAMVFNSGSYDDCAIDRFEVRRMDNKIDCNGNVDSDPDHFFPYVKFCCSDIGAPNEVVILRVWDKAGNYNDCMVQVDVQDKTPPTITCPQDQTVECDYNYDPLKLRTYFGWATAYDNCSVTITSDSSTVSNACYDNPVKTITRNFTATDAAGRTAKCKQKINFVRTKYFGYKNGETNNTGFGQITWPSNPAPITTCMNPADRTNPLSPLHPNQSGFPVLNEYPCDQVGYTWSDFVLIDNDNDFDNNQACFKIIRTWTVLDDCHKVNGSFARWHYDQVITVINNVPPVIVATPNKTVCTYDPVCGTGYIELKYTCSDLCTQNEDLRWRFRIDYYNNNPLNVWDFTSSIHNGNNLDASDTYEIGTHKILWEVWDQCGNKTIREQLFTINNCKKPTPICIDGLAVDLTQMTQGPTAMIKAWMFNKNSYHVCDYDLDFSFSTDVNDTVKTYGCNEIGNDKPITMWVTATLADGTLLQDFCTTTIDIQDNFNLCNNPLPQGIVSGGIITEDNRKLEDIRIKLVGSEMADQMTDINGEYEFPPVNYGSSYTVLPVSNEDYLNGLSTLDLVIIQKHILGLKQLKSPYSYLASDVNNDKKITASDILQLRKIILGVNNKFENNKSWRFISGAFDNLVNPMDGILTESFAFSKMNSNITADFIAVKVGDVSGDATVNKLENIDGRNGVNIGFVMSNNKFDANEIIEVPVYASDFKDVTGLQGTFKYNTEKLDFIEIEAATLDMSTANINTGLTGKGLIPMVWFKENAVDIVDNTPLFVLKFKALKDGDIESSVELSSSVTKTEAYNSAYEVMDINLTFRDEKAGFELWQNNPNPFTYDTEIAFNTDNADKYTLSIYDLNGKLILEKTGSAQKGFNKVDISKSDLNTTGILYYTLSTSDYTATRKMVVLK